MFVTNTYPEGTIRSRHQLAAWSIEGLPLWWDVGTSSLVHHDTVRGATLIEVAPRADHAAPEWVAIIADDRQLSASRQAPWPALIRVSRSTEYEGRRHTGVIDGFTASGPYEVLRWLLDKLAEAKAQPTPQWAEAMRPSTTAL